MRFLNGWQYLRFVAALQAGNAGQVLKLDNQQVHVGLDPEADVGCDRSFSCGDAFGQVTIGEVITGAGHDN